MMSYEEQDVTTIPTSVENGGDVQKADNSANGGSRPAETDNQTGGSANTTSENLPFDKDPKVQRYLNKMRDKDRREYEEKFKSLEERINQSRINQGNSTQQGLSPEEQAAVDTLIEKISMSPKALERLGLTKINTLEEKFNQSSSQAIEQAIESELSSVVKDYSGKYGYEADDLQEELLDFIANDPLFRGKEYHKGVMQKAAKLYFADKGKELAERETNLRLINEKKTKQQNGTETSAKGSASSKGPKLSGKAHLEDFIKREGGGEIAF